MPSAYTNNFDLVGGILLSPRALPTTPSLTANFVAEREAAVRNAIASADAALEDHRRAAAAALAVAAATRESAIASARASAGGVGGTRSAALRSAHTAAMTPLLRSWIFDAPSHALADQIASARAQWLLDCQEQAGAPFRHLICMQIGDVLHAGNATGTNGPRLMPSAAGVRQFISSAMSQTTDLVWALDRSLRSGGAKTYMALQDLEAWFFDRLPQASTMAGASTTTFAALLAAGTVAEAAAATTN